MAKQLIKKGTQDDKAVWGTEVDKLNNNFNDLYPKTTFKTLYITDSFGYGTGTTGNTGGLNTGIMGSFAYPIQATSRLNRSDIISTYYLGLPGRTARQALTTYAATVAGQFDSARQNVVVVQFCANDLNTYSTAVAYQDLINLHLYFQNLGVKTIAFLGLNRTDASAVSGFNAKRLEFNALIAANWRSFADGLIDMRKQPLMYADNAPLNATYFKANDVDGFTGLHPTDAGATLIAEETAQAIANVIGIKLPYSVNEAYPVDVVSTPTLGNSTLSVGTATSSSLPISWTSVANATTYTLSRNTTNSASSATQIYSGSGTSYNDSGLSGSTTYYYFLSVSASGYNNSTATVSGTTAAVSAQTLAATTVTAGTPTSSTIPLSWTAVTNATNYIVTRNTVNSQTGATQIYSGANLSYTDTGLNGSTTYYYFVVATASGFNNSPAATASATTAVGPSTTTVNWGTRLVGGATGTTTVTGSSSTGWVSGASGDKQATSGDVTLTVPSGGYGISASSALVIGISNANITSVTDSYKQIKFGIYVDSTQIIVFELGVSKYTQGLTGAHSLKITVVGGQVKYYVDDVLKYTSATTATYPLIPVVSLNSTSSVSNVTLSAIQATN